MTEEQDRQLKIVAYQLAQQDHRQYQNNDSALFIASTKENPINITERSKQIYNWLKKYESNIS